MPFTCASSLQIDLPDRAGNLHAAGAAVLHVETFARNVAQGRIAGAFQAARLAC